MTEAAFSMRLPEPLTVMFPLPQVVVPVVASVPPPIVVTPE